MASSKDYSIGILGVKKPLDCSCQELLCTPNIVMNGWLRKRALRNKIITMNWPQMYVIVANQCLYYYSSETAKKPSGAISFYGFNRICRAPRVKVKDVVWAFKLEHIQPKFHSLYFSASSEKDMIKWMRVIKREMLSANGKSNCTTGDSQYGESIASEDSWGSSDYNFLESSIYEEPVCRPLSMCTDIGKGMSDDSDYEDGEDVNSTDQFEPRVHPSAPVMSEYDTGYSTEKRVSSERDRAGTGNDYWNAVRFDGSKLQASEIIANIGQDGSYLVRKSEDDSDVIVVYAGQVRKYRVMNQGNGKKTLSAKTEPEFDNMEDLLYHYYSNNLPHCNQKLTCPFKLHEDYQER